MTAGESIRASLFSLFSREKASPSWFSPLFHDNAPVGTHSNVSSRLACVKMAGDGVKETFLFVMRQAHLHSRGQESGSSPPLLPSATLV